MILTDQPTEAVAELLHLAAIRHPRDLAAADIDIDREMRREGIRWWLAVDGDTVLATAAIWPNGDHLRAGLFCEPGHAYRIDRYWLRLMARVQAYIVRRNMPAVSYVYADPARLLRALQWQVTDQGVDAEREVGWWRMEWTPQSEGIKYEYPA